MSRASKLATGVVVSVVLAGVALGAPPDADMGFFVTSVGSGKGADLGGLARSYASLREVGNLSSASVLFVLADHLAAGEARPGDLGLLAAMGPGFAAELVLLRW